MAAAPAHSFIPADFDPPTLVEAQGFKLVPLGPDVVEQDYAAYMSSIEHLQQTFSRSTGWPHAGLTLADSMVDMESEAARFAARESFAYGVLTPDGQYELGSVYVRPSPVAGYDAVVSLWVTKAQYDAGFDAVLYRWVRDWVAREWPFEKVAYPGRAIAWDEWDALAAEAGG
ncbi:twin-arginine translocation pathway signal protein [Aurantiacibacter xanthus]|nr:twin-arginine translocation pathway signal protein [Aurantiacibacter xanthus]